VDPKFYHGVIVVRLKHVPLVVVQSEKCGAHCSIGELAAGYSAAVPPAMAEAPTRSELSILKGAPRFIGRNRRVAPMLTIQTKLVFPLIFFSEKLVDENLHPAWVCT